MTVKSAAPYVIAAVAGATLWVVTANLTDQREAWDAARYWNTAYPLGIAAVTILGYAAPKNGAWRLGLTLMLAQAVAWVIIARPYNTLGDGIVLFGLLSVPVGAMATLGAWLRRRRASPITTEAVQ